MTDIRWHTLLRSDGNIDICAVDEHDYMEFIITGNDDVGYMLSYATGDVRLTQEADINSVSWVDMVEFNKRENAQEHANMIYQVARETYSYKGDRS